MAKNRTKAESKHMDNVASLGCVICLNLGYGYSPATIHHCGTHMGGGRTHQRVLPLCPEHHQGREGIDGKAMGKRQWEMKYGTERDLLSQVELLLQEQERLKV